jgi:hypothetical protein
MGACETLCALLKDVRDLQWSAELNSVSGSDPHGFRRFREKFPFLAGLLGLR